MDTKLKIVAGLIVTESKMSKATKLQLLNFIQKEATIPQIKVLLMDGEIVSLDKQAEEIANARFEGSKIQSKSKQVFEKYQTNLKKKESKA